MEQLLEMLMIDLQKSDRNKTAAQRVRTNSIKFSKLAKVFRKESMEAIKPKKKAKKKTKGVKTRKNMAAKSRTASRRKRARA